VRENWEASKGTAIQTFAKGQLAAIRQGSSPESAIVRKVVDDLYAYL
jgi:hypothetical protein